MDKKKSIKKLKKSKLILGTIYYISELFEYTFKIASSIFLFYLMVESNKFSLSLLRILGLGLIGYIILRTFRLLTGELENG